MCVCVCGGGGGGLQGQFSVHLDMSEIGLWAYDDVAIDVKHNKPLSTPF